ncbi:hypothetical protein MO973_13000 [Paenibacillus sp. TRM 82003]|nr:hypothetical protein [Paenibacillus sp. TRM 82003]
MKKSGKVLMIGAAVAAVSLFTVTALASTPNTAGYDAFKEVLKANHMTEDAIESATLNGSFTAAVNGEAVLTVDGTAKMLESGDAQRVSGDFDLTIDGIERSGSVYAGNDDTLYLVDRTHDLHYQVINADPEDEYEQEWNSREVGNAEHRSMTKAEEALLDYLVGDLKNEFAVERHADGSKTITVDVSKDEIPLPLRLMMDVASADDRNEHANDRTPETTEEWERIKQFPFFQGFEEIDLEQRLPELTDDVAIERVKLQLTVDSNNELQRVAVELDVSGKDEAGDTHRVEIEGAGEIIGINATTPDVYDPSGKSIEIIDADAFDDRD